MLEIKLLTDLRQRRIDSLRRKISEKKDSERQNFFSRYQTFENILHFENATNILDIFVREKPEQMTQGHYLRCLKKINFFGYDMKKLDEHINPLDMRIIRRVRENRSTFDSPYLESNDEYSSQEEYSHPSYESLRENLHFLQIPPESIAQKKSDETEGIRKDIAQIIEKSKDLTLDSGSLIKEDYSGGVFFDLPLEFASACYNSRDLGNGYIIENTPEMFKDIDQDRLLEAMDLFSTRYRTAKHQKDKPINMEIDGKNFFIEIVKYTRESVILKIKDDEDNSVILKLYRASNVYSDDPISFPAFALYGSLGLQREANLAGVSDVAEIYIANPILMPNDTENESYMGGWAILQDLKEDEDSKEGIKLRDWLEQKGLSVSEYMEENNDYFDVYAILNPEERSFYCESPCNQAVDAIYLRYPNYETTPEILKSLKEEDN